MALVTGVGKPPERTAQTYAQWLANHEQSHIRQIERIVNTLRGLDYLRSAGVRPDARMAEALDLVVSKRDVDGRWPLENVHPEQLDAEPGTAEGQPSRWNTLRASRVLGWYAAGA